ncbi:hypothetical protein M436DRAFT_64350 [Aureobasidium namibiae CBS 147.97]|uniref:Uncharacterized protein n=1 Tax=Aureobasidium namibiae CBS 147.97 TaxID=1043004 RepID=A0A074WGW0_9PEZI
MKELWDTRGGIPNIAWCSAFQFKRKIFRSGTNSRSYTAIRRARRDYCKELLEVFDDSLSFENQNWQAVQTIIDAHKRLFQECQCEQCRMRRLEARAGDGDDDDADNDPNNRNDHPEPDRNDNDDDDDGDDGNQRTWQHELSRLRRRRLLGSATGNNEEDLLDDDQNLVDMEDDNNPNVDMENISEDVDMDDDAVNTDDIVFGDGSQSSSWFVPRSREASPDDDACIGSGNNDLDDNSDIDYESIFGMRLGRRRTPTSPSVPDSPITPKLEPKPEPETEIITYTKYTRFRQTCDLIDLTGEDDDSMGSDNSGMEVIELTDDSSMSTEPTRTNSRYDAIIDLTQTSEDFQNSSPMQIIELDD